MTHEVDDETLNQYFDGELPPEKQEMVRLVLESSADDRARLARLARVRDLVRMAAADAEQSVDSDDLFRRIQGGIQEQTDAGFGEGFRVVEGGGVSYLSERPVERWKVSVPVTLGLAAAAAAFLALSVSGGGTKVTDGPDVPPVEERIEAPLGSEVESVDFGANTGTVFAVKGAAGEPLAVVWLSDEADDVH